MQEYSEERNVQIGEDLDYETESNIFQIEEDSRTEKFDARSYTIRLEFSTCFFYIINYQPSDRMGLHNLSSNLLSYYCFKVKSRKKSRARRNRPVRKQARAYRCDEGKIEGNSFHF